MILFLGRNCPTCRALERELGLAPQGTTTKIGELRVYVVDPSAEPASEIEADALAMADFWDVASVPALVTDASKVDEPPIVTDAFEIARLVRPLLDAAAGRSEGG